MVVLISYRPFKKDAHALILLIPVIDDDFKLTNVIAIFDVMEHIRYENGYEE